MITDVCISKFFFAHFRFPSDIPDGTSIPAWAFDSLPADDFVFDVAETNTGTSEL